MGVDIKEISTYEEIFHMIMSGSVTILIDGYQEAIAFSMVGYAFRSPMNRQVKLIYAVLGRDFVKSFELTWQWLDDD